MGTYVNASSRSRAEDSTYIEPQFAQGVRVGHVLTFERCILLSMLRMH
jgi:hypothetical protein